MDDEVVFRQFCCPGCWTAVHSSIVPAAHDDHVLELDRLLAAAPAADLALEHALFEPVRTDVGTFVTHFEGDAAPLGMLLRHVRGSPPGRPSSSPPHLAEALLARAPVPRPRAVEGHSPDR